MIDDQLKDGLWKQFGASLDMLKNAIALCPESLWNREDFWYLAYHTLFWTDLYIHGSVDGFEPPAPFTLGELDPTGVMPDRTYSKEELTTYLDHCRARARTAILQLDEARAQNRCSFGWGEASYFELLLYNMRHVQHGAAQLNLHLRQRIDNAPGWVAKARD